VLPGSDATCESVATEKIVDLIAFNQPC
jgi:hypothetical protein